MSQSQETSQNRQSQQAQSDPSRDGKIYQNLLLRVFVIFSDFANILILFALFFLFFTNTFFNLFLLQHPLLALLISAGVLLFAVLNIFGTRPATKESRKTQNRAEPAAGMMQGGEKAKAGTSSLIEKIEGESNALLAIERVHVSELMANLRHLQQLEAKLSLLEIERKAQVRKILQSIEDDLILKRELEPLLPKQDTNNVDHLYELILLLERRLEHLEGHENNQSWMEGIPTWISAANNLTSIIITIPAIITIIIAVFRLLH